MMESQLSILSESLDKKIEVLKKIQEYNAIQEQSFESGQARLEDFDEAVAQKGRLIEEVNQLDEGFELLYGRLAEELKGNRQRYAAQIQALQQKIARVMEMSVAVQAQEQRNKKLIEAFFAKERAGIREGRKASRAAYGYYKNMSATNYVPPQFYDSKK